MNKPDFEGYKSTVQFLLLTEPRTRVDDTYLVLRVLEKKGVDVHKPYDELSAQGYLDNVETITRLRRKIQCCNPSLGRIDVQQRRQLKSKKVKKYLHNFKEDVI